ncbi:MAG: hypothetical protein ACR5LH_15805, partial [Sodalis sp. (in: enterobacteria)]
MLKLTHFFGRGRRNDDTDSLDGPPRFSLILQVAASALFLAVVLVSLTGWHLYHTYQLALSRSQTNILNLTQALSQHANDTFMQAEILLTDLAQRIAQDGLAAAQQGQLHPLFTAALLNKSELADRMALYYTCYPILTLCGIPNNVIRFSALTIA